MLKKQMLTIIITLILIFSISPAAMAKSKDPTEPASIAYNKIDFDEINKNDAPLGIKSLIEYHKSERGFAYYIDYSSGCTYIAVLRGQKNTSGYGVSVVFTEEVDGKINVYVKETDPSPGAITLQVITYPTAIIKIKSTTVNISVKSLNSVEYKNLTPNSQQGNVNFEAVDRSAAPNELNKLIDAKREKQGFLYYEDKYSGYVYVAILRGEKNTLGYEVYVKSITNINGAADIQVIEINPAKESVKAINYPYTIIRSKDITTNITVKSSNSEYKNLMDKSPVIGTGCIIGTFKKAGYDNKYVYIVIEDSRRNKNAYYTTYNSSEWLKLSKLKAGDEVYIKYTLGTPVKYDSLSAFPYNEIVLLNENTDDNVDIDIDIGILEIFDLNWVSLNPYNNVDINKVWTIKFNKRVNINSIDRDGIYIRDISGNKIPVEILSGTDEYSIKVKPAKNYAYGQTYYLFISSDLIQKDVEHYHRRNSSYKWNDIKKMIKINKGHGSQKNFSIYKDWYGYKDFNGYRMMFTVTVK